MSTNTEKQQQQQASAAAGTTAGASEFDNCVPQSVTVEKVMSDQKCADVWAGLYKKAGIASRGENEKKALRCAVYGYLAVNGCSPSGTYSGTVKSATGAELMCSEIPNLAGRYNVRQFGRANGQEALRFFYATRFLVTNEAMKAKCSAVGMSEERAVALVDFLDVANGVAPADKDAAVTVRQYSLRRANAARGGHSLDEIRDRDLDRSVAAQLDQGAKPPSESGGW